ncbi:energy transducer TonB [Pseudoteredinibacter isoporae]|uniref:energy transducer TonB n=1 Tax=Pseudoteredinibacter isoporae TaxID=570281 RepID=UPI0031060FB7
MRYLLCLLFVCGTIACSSVPQEQLDGYPQFTPEEMGVNVLDKLVKSPTPRYPSLALEVGLEGYCIVQFNITPDGTTYNSKRIKCTHPIFTSSSLKSADELLFEKPMYKGQRVIIKDVSWKVSFAISK